MFSITYYLRRVVVNHLHDGESEEAIVRVREAVDTASCAWTPFAYSAVVTALYAPCNICVHSMHNRTSIQHLNVRGVHVPVESWLEEALVDQTINLCIRIYFPRARDGARSEAPAAFHNDGV